MKKAGKHKTSSDLYRARVSEARNFGDLPVEKQINWLLSHQYINNAQAVQIRGCQGDVAIGKEMGKLLRLNFMKESAHGDGVSFPNSFLAEKWLGLSNPFNHE